MDKIEDYARTKGLNCVIAVYDPHGNPVAVHVMEDAFLASYAVATQKAYTAVALKMSTKELNGLVQPGGQFYGLESLKGGDLVAFEMCIRDRGITASHRIPGARCWH